MADIYAECMECDAHRQGSAGTIASWARAHEDDGCPPISETGDDRG